MKIAFDVEANGLDNATQIWVIVCKELSSNSADRANARAKDINTKKYEIFRNLTSDVSEKERFQKYVERVETWVGHNILGYDISLIKRLLDIDIDIKKCIDTYIISKLANYSREEGHSIESYGLEFNHPKSDFDDYSKYSLDLERRCLIDVDICEQVYHKYIRYINKSTNSNAISMEQEFQYKVIQGLIKNGFAFNKTKSEKLLSKVEEDLQVLDKAILEQFPPKLTLLREVDPKVTKYGTLNRTDFRWLGPVADLSDYNGGPFSRCTWTVFNPSSTTQVVSVLNQAGWRPVDKTKTHILTERELLRLKREKNPEPGVALKLNLLYTNLDKLKKTGWKVNEENLATLPKSAPGPARTLAKRILLESRRRTLVEWLGLLQEDGRIHGRFQGIGAWTQRMAHQNPNTANIPNAQNLDGSIKLLGGELRSLWMAPKGRLLVGCDAEGIQLRVFAHYINDEEFTNALVRGRKDDKSDPHSLNQRILGRVCKTRASAKRFIYALLLGAGLGKLGEILGCGEAETQQALSNLIARYHGFAELKRTIIPRDGKRGWFEGLDGRTVPLLGDTPGQRAHLAMSGYLQNGEVIIMKMATLKFWDKLADLNSLLVNLVHDEWQVETPNNMDIALQVAELMAGALKETGDDLKLLCPLAGSYWNDDIKDYTIGTNWKVTH